MKHGLILVIMVVKITQMVIIYIHCFGVKH